MLGDLFYHFKKFATDIADYYNCDVVTLEFYSDMSGVLVAHSGDLSYNYDIFMFDNLIEAVNKMHKEVNKVRDDGKTHNTDHSS